MAVRGRQVEGLGHPNNEEVMPKNLYLRAGIYWARFKVGGQEYRESLRTRSERVAVKRLASLREQVEDQAVYGIAGPVAWPDAVVSWAETIAAGLGERTYARYTCSLRQLRSFLDHRPVQEITADVLKEIVKARRRSGVSNATIRRDLTAVSSVLAHAADEGWIAENPSDTVSRRRIAPVRTVPIVLPVEAEIVEAFARMEPRVRDIFAFTRETGLRLEEVCTLRHAALDRVGRILTVANGKGDKTRAVPLTAAAAAIADRQLRYIGQPWVFWHGKGERFTGIPSRTSGLMRRMAQKAAREKIAFTGFSHHDLRHLFAVEYLRNGRGSIYDLQGEMGHGSIAVTERYLAFLTPEQARDAKSRVAQRGAHAQRFGAAEA